MRPALGWHRNLGLKLLSVTLACLLWLYVEGTKVVERELQLALRCTNLPDSLLVTGGVPPTARVLVAGQAQELLLRRFVPSAELRLDLGRARPPGVRLVPSPSDVAIGPEDRLHVLRVVEPAVLEVAIDRRSERVLPVRAVTAGQPASGYALEGEARATPATVRCRGPATRLASLRDVPTRPLDLTGERGPLAVRLDLDPGPNGIACEPAAVLVEANVAQLRQRALSGHPLTVLTVPGADYLVEVRPPRATVTVSGPQPEIDALDPEDVAIVLDLTALRPGTYRGVKLVPRLPHGARLDSLDPAVVDVTIRRRGRAR